MKKKQGLWALLIGLPVLMLGLIPVAVDLLGGKEISQFDPAEYVIFFCFLGLEMFLLLALFLVAFQMRPKEGKLLSPKPSSDAVTDTERILRRRAALLQLVSVVLALLTYFGGHVFSAEGRQSRIVPALAYGLPLSVLLLGLLSWLLARWRRERLTRMPVKELQQWLLSHREQAEQAAEEKLRLLRRLRLGTDGYALLVTLLGLGGACFSGLLRRTDLALPLLLSVMAVDLGVTRFRFPDPKSVLTDSFDLVEKEHFPQLYTLAQRAASAHGRRAPFRVGLTPDCNACICRVGDTDLILLGVVLLNLLSEEELFEVLLHEYGHTGNSRVQRETDYYDWMGNMRDKHFLHVFSQLLYAFPDEAYGLQYSLFRFANSIGEENRADRAMAQLGDPRLAASVLLKIKYEELYSYEEEALDYPDAPDLGSLIRSRISGRLEALRQAFRERASFYNACIRREIQPQMASHPVQRERLTSLGVSDYRLAEDESSESFRAETRAAMELMENRMIERSDPKDYERYHDRLLKLVKEWEACGRPLQEETYPDTVGALKELGRLSEAMELCRRAMEELPEGNSKAYAEYMRGCWLLHRWDASGLEHIYHVIGEYSKYIDEGLDQIGSFCCLTGNREELERYRSRGQELLQQEKDVYSQITILKKGDRLSAERLPPEMEQRIRLTVERVDHGQIDKLYLLHKQITEGFFTSAMILRFRSDVSDEDREETFHQIFLLLDAIDHWQFSLFNYEEAEKVKPEEIEGSVFYTGRKREDNSEFGIRNSEL